MYEKIDFFMKEFGFRYGCNVTLQHLATGSKYIQPRNQLQVFYNNDIGATYLLKESILCYMKSF